MAEGEAEPPTTVHVITETRNLRSSPFIAPEEPCATGNAWEEWLEAIEREFRYFKITDPIDKKDALIIYGGKEVAKLEKTLPNPETGNPYEKLRIKLNTQEEQALRPIPIPQVETKPRRIDEQLRSETSRKSNRLRVRRHS